MPSFRYFFFAFWHFIRPLQLCNQMDECLLLGLLFPVAFVIFVVFSLYNWINILVVVTFHVQGKALRMLVFHMFSSHFERVTEESWENE